MRALRSSGWLAGSLVAHALILTLLPLRRVGVRTPASTPLVEIVTPPEHRPAAPASTSAPVAAAVVAVAANRRAQHRAERPARAAEAPTVPADRAAQAAPAPAASPAPIAPGSVDLFSRPALDAVVGPPPPPAWGGRTRRAGDPVDRDETAEEARVVGDRVRGWIADSLAQDRARAGDVAPRWRDLERQVDARFRPTIGEITDQSIAEMMRAQLRRGFATAPTSGPFSRADHPLAPSDFGGLGRGLETQAQARALAENFEGPASWRRVEIEVLLDADGQLLEARIVSSSRRRPLDAAALDAVRRAAAQLRPERDARGATVARFAIDAAVSVEMPQAMPGLGGGPPVLKLFGLTFDEVTGKISKIAHMFKRHIHTRTTLLSVRPAPQPAPAP